MWYPCQRLGTRKGTSNYSMISNSVPMVPMVPLLINNNVLYIVVPVHTRSLALIGVRVPMGTKGTMGTFMDILTHRNKGKQARL